MQGHVRDISESTPVSDAIARLVSFFRIISEPAVAVSELLERLYGAVREIIEPTALFDDAFFDDVFFDTAVGTHVAVFDTVTRQLSAERAMTETTTGNDTIDRILGVLRVIAEPDVLVNDIVGRLRTSFATMAETVTNSDSVDRILGAMRTISEPSILVSDLVDRIYGAERVINETAISALDSVARTLGAERTISEPSISIMDSIQTIVTQVRIMLETVPVSDILTKLKSKIRVTIAFLTKRSADADLTDRSATSYLTKRDNADGDYV